MELKAVLFDLDDTLYTSFKEGDAYALFCLAEYARAHLNVDGAAFVQAFQQNRKRLRRQLAGVPVIHDRVLFAQGALEQLGLNVPRYAYAVHRVYWEAMFSKMELRPGVHELLAALRQAGVKIALCTDMLADIQLEKLLRLGIAEDIDYLVSSEEAGMDKPGAAVFRLALQKCGCLPAQAVMVGDNFRHDIQGAVNIGIAGIWLNWTKLPSPEACCAYTEVHTFAQAAEHIRALLYAKGENNAAL